MHLVQIMKHLTTDSEYLNKTLHAIKVKDDV